MKRTQNRAASSQGSPRPKTKVAPPSEERSERVPPSPEEADVVACDVCGSEVGREEALFEELDGDLAVYCGEPCRAAKDSVEVDRGPAPDERA